MTTEVTRKTTASSGNSRRSKTCTRLWPKKATAICAATTRIRHSQSGSVVRVDRASAPLTLLTANQPTPATIALSPAGSALPNQPKPIRDRIICGTPNAGPRADSTPWLAEPSAVPSTMAATACQNDCPNATTASTPTKMVANSRFGDIQVQNRSSGRPCRSDNGMNSAPPGSTATMREPYSPSRISAGIPTAASGAEVVVMRLPSSGGGQGMYAEANRFPASPQYPGCYLDVSPAHSPQGC